MKKLSFLILTGIFLLQITPTFAAMQTWDFTTPSEYVFSNNLDLQVNTDILHLVYGNHFVANNIIGDMGVSLSVTSLDADGDGDLDIYVAHNFDQQNKLWINNGLGSFTSADIPGDMGVSWGSTMGDIDGDGDLDIYVANSNDQQNKLWINNGLGLFTSADIPGDMGSSIGATMGDVDGDSDLDIYVANANNQQNKLWINNGLGLFTSADIPGDMGSSYDATMGDIDGDSDLDIYVANYDWQNSNGQQNKLWINNGLGSFTSADILGDTGNSQGATMGDIDGDGDLDIYVANSNDQQNKLWINNGLGSFTSADISGDTGISYDATMGDVDGDGDLDIYVANQEQNKLWINNGSGSFTSADIFGDIGISHDATMGDVDGDGNLDIYVLNYSQQNKLWLNQGLGYSTKSPYIQPSTAGVVFSSSLSSFAHTLGSGNQGTVSYQVSTDNGTTWNYWNGSVWTPTTQTNGSETSSVTDINTNIATLDTDGGQFLWRAYLNSDGTQPVELESISIDGTVVSISLTNPTTDIDVMNQGWFPITTEVSCDSTEDCGDVEVTLDPIGDVFFERTQTGSEEDCITDNVCIARADYNWGIHNSVSESSFNWFDSPADTKWYNGACGNDPTIHTYGNWMNVVGGGWNPNGAVGNAMCMHLITDNIYIDIEFKSWNWMGTFSYYRSSAGKGIIPTTPTQPFWTNKLTNPITVHLKAGETHSETFWVYADGTVGDSFKFFSYVTPVGGTDFKQLSEKHIITLIAPVANNIPTAISLDSNTLTELQVQGTLIGNLSTTDADMSDTHTYSFSCVNSGTNDTDFQISGSQLQVKNSLPLGIYNVCIVSYDGQGGFIEQSFDITYRDAVSPIVTLSGSSDITIIQGEVYTEYGATWIDNVDGTGIILTATSGSINTDIQGIYTLEYTHTDTAGNIGTINRTVTIIQPAVTGGSSGGGGGGSGLIKDNCPNGDYSHSYYDNTCGKNPTNATGAIDIIFNDSDVYNKSIPDAYCYKRKANINIVDSASLITTEEFKKAITFLYAYDMTMFRSIDDFDLYRTLTREEAAKIFSNFAMNVLCRKTNTNLQISYNDIKNSDSTLQSYITLAYQLGLMKGGQDGSFRPFDVITKAEFNAVLVRMILKSYLPEDTGDVWYTEYNTISSKLGIIQYDADNTSLSRNDAALMLFRAYKKQQFSLQDIDYKSFLLDTRDEFVQ